MRKYSVSLFVLVFVSALCVSACSQSARGIARGIFVASEVAESEISGAIQSGDISQADGARVGAYVHEVGSSARVLELTAASWKALSPPQKREAILRFVRETSEAEARLDAAGEPVFKSEKARARYVEFQKWLRRAETALRVIEESLPASGQETQ